MSRLSIIVETEQSLDQAAMPLWRSEHTAAVVPVRFHAGPDDYGTPAVLGPQMAAAAKLLMETPEPLRWLGLGDWFGLYEFASPEWGGVKHPQPHNPKPDRLTAACEYLAEVLRGWGVDALAGIYIDNEGQARKADGTIEKNEQARRMAFLRRCAAPLVEAFGCPVLNFACASPRDPAKTLGWWGAPLGRGTIDGTQSVDTYSCRGDAASEWSVKRANIRECLRSGPVIPHGPALYRYEHKVYCTVEEAAQDTYDAIIADTAAGCRTHFIAAYMWPDREHWPLLADTIKRAAASAARLYPLEDAA